MEALYLALSIISTFFAVFAAVVSVMTRIRIEAFERSTHQVQFVPAEPGTKDEDLDDAIGRSEDAQMDRLDEIHRQNEPLM